MVKMKKVDQGMNSLLNWALGNTFTVTRETNIIQGVLVVAVIVGLVIQLCMAQVCI